MNSVNYDVTLSLKLGTFTFNWDEPTGEKTNLEDTNL